MKITGEITIPVFGENQVTLRHETKPFFLKLMPKKVSCNTWSWASEALASPSIEGKLSCKYTEIETSVGPEWNHYRLIEFLGEEDNKTWNRYRQTSGFVPSLEIQTWDNASIHVSCWYKKNGEAELETLSAELDQASSEKLEDLWKSLLR